MKKAIALIALVAAGFAGGALWMKNRQPAPPGEHGVAAPATAAQEAAGPQLSRDTNGNVVIALSEKARKELDIEVAKPTPFEMRSELKGYGRVLDPAPLAGLMTDLAAAQAAAAASSNELARLKTLEPQGNVSARALQTAEAVAVRDRVAVDSVKERITLSWGNEVSAQADLLSFVRLLVSQGAALVRVDLPVDEALPAPPAGARLTSLSGHSAAAQYLGRAPRVEPDVQGQGFQFLLKPNSLQLVPGAALVGYLAAPGEPVPGIIVPREAVVRTEGATWVYVLNGAGDAVSRVPLPVDRPTDTGWFVTRGLSAADAIVVTGAQQLLSCEVRSAGGAGE